VLQWPSLTVGLLTRALRLVLTFLISSQGVARAVVVMPKQRERIFGRRDLSVIARLFKFTAAIDDFRALSRARSGPPQHTTARQLVSVADPAASRRIKPCCPISAVII